VVVADGDMSQLSNEALPVVDGAMDFTVAAWLDGGEAFTDPRVEQTVAALKEIRKREREAANKGRTTPAK
jgi:hypothetical protein